MSSAPPAPSPPSELAYANHYPLDIEPCVPVSVDGLITHVGFRELFVRAHEIDALSVALPPATSGLLRILTAMAARVTGLDKATDVAEWMDRRYDLLEQAGKFDRDAVGEYFDEHAGGLRLHDPVRPFLQDPRLATECASSSGANKLVLARPAGNNQVFFGHFTDAEPAPLPPREALLHLIVQLYYGPSGQCTPRTVDGQKYGNSRGGPLRRALSCHPMGRNLFETLVLGIPEPSLWPQGERHTSGDSCPWERTELPDPLHAPGVAAGPLSLLTEQYQHAVLLRAAPDRDSVVDATITWALRENRPPVRDPYLIWDEAKDGTVHPRDAKAERALWRDLDALVLQNRGGESRRPLIFEGLSGSQLPEPVFEGLRVIAHGFDQDGQTRDRTYFSATTPPLFALLSSFGASGDTDLAGGLKEGREAAEKAAWRLTAALRSAWRAYTTPFAEERAGGAGRSSAKGGAGAKGDGPWPEGALSAYWPAAEEHFWSLLAREDFGDAVTSFGRIALEIYDDVTAAIASEPRGARARERTRGLVRSLLDDGRDR
ncbi:type I-E CRISPR-associated protein Cse1/CasA [Streptomyces cyaneofuscatus]|uniref:type I-E CRISPR-associated protein Cse1/CasA n=1 Tax=Streptomyces cyaneofuscatus TaxID=66883 RepID=UPI00341160B9